MSGKADMLKALARWKRGLRAERGLVANLYDDAWLAELDRALALLTALETSLAALQGHDKDWL